MKHHYRLFSFCSIVFLFLGITSSMFAQQKISMLSGKVFTSDGKPVPNVSVVISELQKSEESNSQGEYMFQDIPSGQYTLSFYFIGLQPSSVKVSHWTGN